MKGLRHSDEGWLLARSPPIIAHNLLLRLPTDLHVFPYSPHSCYAGACAHGFDLPTILATAALLLMFTGLFRQSPCRAIARVLDLTSSTALTLP